MVFAEATGQQRIAVRRGGDDGLGGDIAGGAVRFSTTNGWPSRSEPLADQPRHQVRRAAAAITFEVRTGRVG